MKVVSAISRITIFSVGLLFAAAHQDKLNGNVPALRGNGGGNRRTELQPTCTNLNWDSAPDTSCNIDYPICVKDGIEVTGWEAPGDACVVCVNNIAGDDHSYKTDKGCSSGPPHVGKAYCVQDDGTQPEHNKAGTKCAIANDFDDSIFFCVHDQWGPAPDQFCNVTFPICVNNDTEVTAPWYAMGDECAFCVNNNDVDGHHWNPDKGCHQSGYAGEAEAYCVKSDGAEPSKNGAGTKCSTQIGFQD
eukprot:CAMPEP_0198141316 /NCGR_PEP_ID=MMETSP1443-20131203/4342_1 /TAXON_ID=186043 /ORGANISM="Entomoneis sp., Strain CCMP2396" /LENGTH=245 /DNA_ID=CAMNT_0043804033 /DNA_START=178 /DNA_END=915 /DNA_ORIENTATION=+